MFRLLVIGLIMGSALRAPGADPAPAAAQPAREKPPHARVVVVRNAAAMDSFNPQSGPVAAMVKQGLLHLTGQTGLTEAWGRLIAPQDTVGIKVHASPGATGGTRPAVVAAVVQSLLDAGHAASRIVIWDKHLADLRRAGFVELGRQFEVRVAGSADEGYDPKVFYDTAPVGQLVWGDHEFGQRGEGIGRKSYVSRLVSQEITKIVSVTPLLNSYQSGVAGNLYSLALGSVDNTLRFEKDWDRLVEAIPEIVALPEVGDRVVLGVVDALICQYEGEQSSLLHYSTRLNQLRFSTDPVALDVLSLQELEVQRPSAVAGPARDYMTLYRNATMLELGVSEARAIRVETLSNE